MIKMSLDNFCRLITNVASRFSLRYRHDQVVFELCILIYYSSDVITASHVARYRWRLFAVYNVIEGCLC